MSIPQIKGMKHSSLDRVIEIERLALRDRVRPDFKILTGNDLGIDMIEYGSDYLLGLSTFAPDLFAKRDAMWEAGDPGFYELNDLLLVRSIEHGPLSGFFAKNGQLDDELAEYFGSFDLIITYLFDPDCGSDRRMRASHLATGAARSTADFFVCAYHSASEWIARRGRSEASDQYSSEYDQTRTTPQSMTTSSSPASGPAR